METYTRFIASDGRAICRIVNETKLVAGPPCGTTSLFVANKHSISRLLLLPHKCISHFGALSHRGDYIQRECVGYVHRECVDYILHEGTGTINYLN